MKIFFKDKIKIKTFPDEHKLRKLVTSREEMYYQKNANGSYSGWRKNIAIEKQIYTKDEDCKNGNIMINIKKVFPYVFISLKIDNLNRIHVVGFIT